MGWEWKEAEHIFASTNAGGFQGIWILWGDDVCPQITPEDTEYQQSLVY